MNFKNKIIWLTGASSGIGEQLCYNLNKNGAQLIISARREDELNRVKLNCTSPDNVFVLPLDLTDSASIQKAVQTILAKFQYIDILVNNGGVSQRSKTIETVIEVDRKIMEINYFGTVALTKAVLPSMIARKQGHIVVNSSITGKVGFPERSAYSASKHALFGFFDSLRAETWKDGIRVTMVCFGFVKTNLPFNALTKDGSKNNKMDDNIANGLSPEYAAQRFMQAIDSQKEEVYISKSKELLGVFLRKFIPTLYSKIIRLKT